MRSSFPPSRVIDLWGYLVADATVAGSLGKLIGDRFTTDYTAARAALLDQITALRMAELDAANLPADIDIIKGDTPYLADLALPGVPTAGSIGALVKSYLDATISSRMAAASYVAERGTDGAALASDYSAIRAALLDNLQDLNGIRRLNFHDDFNWNLLDAEIWSLGGDTPVFDIGADWGGATDWALQTLDATDSDSYLSGVGCTKNYRFNPAEYGCTQVVWEARVAIQTLTDVQEYVGLVPGLMAQYSQPASSSAIIFFDPAISANFRCRSYEAAEEETDSGVAVDDQYHRLKIVWTASSVLFYIDGVLKATHNTQVPTWQLYSEIIIRTKADSSKYMAIDYVDVKVS